MSSFESRSWRCVFPAEHGLQFPDPPPPHIHSNTTEFYLLIKTTSHSPPEGPANQFDSTTSSLRLWLESLWLKALLDSCCRSLPVCLNLTSLCHYLPPSITYLLSQYPAVLSQPGSLHAPLCEATRTSVNHQTQTLLHLIIKSYVKYAVLRSSISTKHNKWTEMIGNQFLSKGKKQSWVDYRWTTSQLPKMKPSHFDCPLVAGCCKGHKPSLLHVSLWEMITDKW